MGQITEMLVTVATLITGVAIVAVLVSRKAQTPAVIQAAASGFGNSLDVAISPVTGATTAPILSYPDGYSSGFGAAF